MTYTAQALEHVLGLLATNVDTDSAGAFVTEMITVGQGPDIISLEGRGSPMVAREGWVPSSFQAALQVWPAAQEVEATGLVICTRERSYIGGKKSARFSFFTNTDSTHVKVGKSLGREGGNERGGEDGGEHGYKVVNERWVVGGLKVGFLTNAKSLREREED